jgi:serine protease Do
MQKGLQRVFTLLVMIVASFSTLCYANATSDPNISSMLQKALPAVVNIKAIIKITDFNTLREIQKERGANPQESEDQPLPSSYVSVASGVVVDAKNGLILTNSHVVNDAQTVVVTLSDGRHFNAKTIGEDKPTDIALLQIKAKNLTQIPLGNSNDLKVGDFVAAIGNPYGLNQTVTSGIVSALGRTTLGIENYENFIQTDAPINPGNSGGALINKQGQLIGINTAILAPERGNIGIGFAIPVNMAKTIVNQLTQYGNVKRGVLGIGAQDITPDLANAFNIPSASGAAVTQVIPNSPAEHAGIQVGDIITSINDTSIKNASDVVNTVGFLRVDSKINISLMRNNKHINTSVTLNDPKVTKELSEKNNPFLYGVGLKHLSLLSPIHGKVEGVLVVSVEQDSVAWQSDLRPGDVITSANQQQVKTIEELKDVVAKADKTLLLNVLRGQGAIFLVMNKESA